MLGHCFIKEKDGSPHQYFHSVSIEDLASGHATESQLGCGNLITHPLPGPCQGHSTDSVYFLPRFFSAGEL